MTGIASAQTYSEKISFDNFGVEPNGTCRLRKVTQVLRNGEPLGEPIFHRYAFEPQTDLSVLDLNAETKYYKNLCLAAWTPEVVKKFKDYQNKFSK